MSDLTPRQQRQEEDRSEPVDETRREAVAFFAWWNEHKHDEGFWSPGSPIQYGHVKTAYEAGFRAGQEPGGSR